MASKFPKYCFSKKPRANIAANNNVGMFSNIGITQYSTLETLTPAIIIPRANVYVYQEFIMGKAFELPANASPSIGRH